ncbi:MAG: SMI1/KNR4 family protein [Pseudomonadota bacterium]
MSTLGDQIRATLLAGMHLPDALERLFAWIEDHGFYVDTRAGRLGFMFDDAALKASWSDSEREGGTLIEFFAEGNVNLKYWFRHERAAVLDRLCVFGKSGADGSMVALWLTDGGEQKIVHLGSGSGSTLVCVLADDPVDFLRLIAIGYDEICWPQNFAHPPNHDPGEIVVHPNRPFQDWVRRTFRTTIPERASELIRRPGDMGDKAPLDPFARWLRTV